MRASTIWFMGTVLLPAAVSGQGSYGFFREARIGIGSMSVQSDAGTNTPGTVSGRLTGLDGFVRLGFIGVRARSLSGELSGAGVSSGNDQVLREAAVVLGARRFALEVGVLQRPATASAAGPRVDLRRAGARSQWNVGSSAVQVTMAGALLFVGDPGFTVSGLDRVGHDVEVEVLVQPTYRVPAFAKLGYRYERLEDPLGVSAQVEGRDGVYIVVGIRYARNVAN